MSQGVEAQEMKPSERMIEIARQVIKDKGKDLDLTKATHTKRGMRRWNPMSY